MRWIWRKIIKFLNHLGLRRMISMSDHYILLICVLTVNKRLFLLRQNWWSKILLFPRCNSIWLFSVVTSFLLLFSLGWWISLFTCYVGLLHASFNCSAGKKVENISWFCSISCFLSICVFSIYVSTGIYQHFNDLKMTLISCHHQWSPTSLIWNIDICPCW